MKNKLKTIVVGAGGGGIASALLSSLRGEEVTLIESHSALGGCASWFRRGQFVFDAGATTLSGVGENEPMGELFKLLGARPELYPADPGIVFHLSSGKIISYYRDFEKWMEELNNHFPHLPHLKFWRLIREVNQRSWALLHDVKAFPWGALTLPRYYTLVPHLFLSVDHVLKKYQLDDPDYQELIDGILLISAQATSPDVPFLVGAMALSYPAETYAPVGGMKGLMDFFENELVKKGVQIKTKARVKKFSFGKVFLEGGEEFSGDQIISNLPLWNLAHMTEGTLKKDLQKEIISRPGAWGAFTLYFGTQSKLSELYHQVHLNHPKVKNYFVSFSHPDDRKRAPEGYQAVSISTHVYAEDDIDKEYFKKIIMDDFIKRFNIDEIKFLTAGSPKTFERYTGRFKGYVGGIPFLYGKNPLTIPGPITREKGFFRVGDTVFPGQGICGVVAGALQLHKRLT